MCLSTPPPFHKPSADFHEVLQTLSEVLFFFSSRFFLAWTTFLNWNIFLLIFCYKKKWGKSGLKRLKNAKVEMINCSLYPKLWASVSAITCYSKSYLNLSWKIRHGPLDYRLLSFTGPLQLLLKCQGKGSAPYRGWKHCLALLPGTWLLKMHAAVCRAHQLLHRLSCYRGEKEGIKGVYYLCHSYWATYSFLILKSRFEPCSNGSTRGCPEQLSLQLLSLSAWQQWPQLQLKALQNALKNSTQISLGTSPAIYFNLTIKWNKRHNWLNFQEESTTFPQNMSSYTQFNNCKSSLV